MVRALGLAAGARLRPGLRDERTPRAVHVLVGVLAVVAVVTAWTAQRVGGAGSPTWSTVPGLALALVAGAYLHVEFRHGKDDVDALDLFEAAIAPAIFVLPATAAVVLVALAKATAEAVLRIRPVKAAFNTAAWAAAAGTGSLVLAALAGADERSAVDLLWLVVALLAVAVVNKVAFVSVLTLSGQRSLRQSLRELAPAMVPAWVVGGAVTLSFGILFAAAYRWAPATGWLFVVPLAALHWAGRGYAASVADLHRVRGLHRATRALTEPVGLDVALHRFLTELRACFHGEGADLVAVAGDHAVVYGLGEGTGAFADRPTTVVDRDAVEALLALRGGVRVAADEDSALRRQLRPGRWREALVAPVRSGGAPRGALCIYNPGGLGAPDAADMAVLEALAGEVGGTLQRFEAHDQLRRSEARFRGLVQRSSDMVTVLDADGVITDVMPSWRPGSPAGLAASVGQAAVDAAHPADAAAVRSALESLVERPGAVETIRWRARASDGSWRQVETVASNLLDDPSVSGVVLNSRDITDRERAASLMAAQAEVLATIARRSSLEDTVAALGRAIEAQAAGARYTAVLVGQPLGLSAVLGEPLPGKLLDEVLEAFTGDAGAGLRGDRHRPLVVADVEASARWRPLADGADVAAFWAAPIDTSDSGAVLGLSVLHFDRPRSPDAFDRQLLEVAAHLTHIAIEGATTQARLVHQASHDPLTGLPNRRLFLDRTAMALARLPRSGRSLAVLFIDLDRFKAVNDSLGHEAGDQLLIELAGRIRHVMRPSDTVSRFGGDEFTILCEDINDAGEVESIASRVRDSLAAPVVLDGRQVYVTASVGIAHTDDPDRRPQELVDDADAAMYRSKQAGGDHHRIYEPAMRRHARGEWATAQALRHALERGELRVYYQPTVSLRTGRVLGAEALVRWEHPELGTVEPGEFIGLAERTGLIVPIGRLVLDEACKQIGPWRERAGEGFQMSVNLSARQFTDPSLSATVAAALADADAPPGSLSLEITESVLMENAESTMASLRELQELGVGLAIDDFGTGYSSFSYLKRFAVDVIKVDRSFVSGLGHDPNDEAIVGAVVSLALTLGITTVAEGVETVDQVRMLQALGCGIAQGFYFSRAVPPETFGPSPPRWDV